MPRYHQMYLKAQEELHEMKKRGDPVDRALSHAIGLEAAIGVLHKHNLLTEWADALTRLKAVTNGECAEGLHEAL